MSLENFITNKFEQEKVEGEKEMVEIKVASSLEENLAEKLVDLEENSFKGYDAGSALKKEDFINYIEDPKNVVMVARMGTSIVGYAIAIPLEDAVQNLAKYDPKITENSTENKYYGESITVAEELRKQNLAVEITQEIVEELKKRGAKNFIVHIRSSRGRHDDATGTFLKNGKVLRTIRNWLDSGKDFDCIEYDI